MKLFTIVLGFVLLTYPILCQDALPDSNKIYSMKEVVISATRTEKSPEEVGKSISIISRDAIDNSYIKSLSEFVTGEEGLYLIGARQNFGMNQSIFMRGANSNQTSVMIDDIRITDPSSVNGAPDLSELSVANIDRIEIVRGMNSDLYGSSAIGGVINMVSRKRQRDGFNAELNLDAGTFGKATSLFGQDLFLNYSSPLGLYINTEIINLSIKGIDATVDTVSDTNLFKNRDRDGTSHRDVSCKVGFTNNYCDGYVSYKRTDEKKDLDKRAYTDDDNYRLDFNRNLFTYGLSIRCPKEFGVKFIGGYSEMERKAIDDSSMIDWLGHNDHTYNFERYKGTTSTNDIQFNLKLPRFEFLLGGSLYIEKMISRLYYYSRSIWGVFESITDLDTLGIEAYTNSFYFHSDFNGGLIINDLNNFSLNIGGRLLRHKSFGSEFVYDINPSLKLNSSSLLYVSYATGFNAPSLYQIYSPNKDYMSGITRGNRLLKPEFSSSFEIGLKQSITKSFELNMNYFMTQTKNMIEFVYLWDKNIGLDTLGNNYMRNDYRGDTYLNLGDQKIHGIEFSFQSRISDVISVGGNLSLVDSKIDYKPSNIDTSITHGNHVQIYNNGAFLIKETEYIGLVRRPSTANINLIISPLSHFMLRLDISYVGRKGDVFYDANLGPYGALGTTPVADYTLVDIATKFHIYENFDLGVKIENVFDTKYTEIKGFSTRGRGLYMNLRYSI